MLKVYRNSSIKVISAVLVIAAIISAFLVLGIFSTNAASTVADNGQLKVIGNQLCNSSGKPVVLRGMSSHGLQYYGSYMNVDTIKWLRDDWNVNVVRAANYTAEKGYITNPSNMKSKVVETIDACISNGVYGIIDWHILSDGDPNTYVNESKAFFQEMATKYANSPNVIYEICNEPNGVNWDTIKKYAEQVIPVIRAADPDSVIIVGTPTWSQDVDVASQNPLKYDNLLLACHFYSGTHGQYLRDKISTALRNGSAVFISEWGTSDASGDGGPFLSESTTWLNFLDQNNISWCNWSLCPKNEASAALVGGASTNGGWDQSALSTSGKYVRAELIKRNGSQTSTTTSQTSIVPTSATQTSSPSTSPSPSVQPSVVPTTSSTSSGNVSATYTIASNWGAGAVINVKITNSGSSAINGWTVSWTYSGDQKITNLWNASYTQSGQNVTVTNAAHNGNISAKGSADFGFTITYSGTNSVPSLAVK